jgi:preprotein translocase subunit SecG
MLPSFILIIHVLVCIALILIVLLQSGKGAQMGAAFGGSSQTLFGSPGAAGFLTKITTVAAVVFMITSLLLAFWSTPKRVNLILEQPVSEETVPAGEEEIPQEVP